MTYEHVVSDLKNSQSDQGPFEIRPGADSVSLIQFTDANKGSIVLFLPPFHHVPDLRGTQSVTTLLQSHRVVKYLCVPPQETNL